MSVKSTSIEWYSYTLKVIQATIIFVVICLCFNKGQVNWQVNKETVKWHFSSKKELAEGEKDIAFSLYFYLCDFLSVTDCVGYMYFLILHDQVGISTKLQKVLY